MPEFSKIEEISDSLKQYLQLNYEIIKLEATERTSVISSVLVSSLVIGVTMFLFVLALSIGAGFYLSTLFGQLYLGFAIIAGFYLLLALVLFVFRKKLIENPFRDKIIRKIVGNKKP